MERPILHHKSVDSRCRKAPPLKTRKIGTKRDKAEVPFCPNLFIMTDKQYQRDSMHSSSVVCRMGFF